VKNDLLCCCSSAPHSCEIVRASPAHANSMASHQPNIATRLRQTMVYREFKPGKSLRPYVMAYWSFRVAPEAGEIMHSIPLTGAAKLSVSVSAGRITLVGPRTRPLQVIVRGGDEFWGVHFVPGAAEALLGVPGGSLRDVQAEVAGLVDRRWVDQTLAGLRRAHDVGQVRGLLDRQFSMLTRSAPRLDSAVMRCVALIVGTEGAVPIARIAAEVGLSERQLRRRFRVATGLTPKELARVRRVRAAAVDAVYAHTVHWADIAADCGYADQSHLISEFRRTLGLTPVSFGRHARRIEHVHVLR
jgi:AraC-like DNA-binding protein